ncbi:angiotensin-converting enzyme-like isoform X2 [Tubulanus polymorphus]|uniref:angiotensin-converting enzyme-like isoform X2 n=1 Tax=Tubulanus polymorphus TaxID=672921 RepID=UPI003DA1DB7C
MMIVFLILPAITAVAAELNMHNETKASTWLNRYDDQAERINFNIVDAAWNYTTNLTEANSKIKEKYERIGAEFALAAYVNASEFDWKNFTNSTLKRMFHFVTNIGFAALNENTKIKKYTEIVTNMETIYATGKVCKSKNQCLELEPDLTRTMAESRDYNELLWAWKSWRDAVGPKLRNIYSEFVELSNEASKSLGFEDTGDEWRQSYESKTFETDIGNLFRQLQPFYKNLHAYVRYRLTKKYGEESFPQTGQIPAHLLGNMWSQSWLNIFDIVTPFPDEPSLAVRKQMVYQNYTALRMFHLSDDFFASLGLERMPNEFWNKSMIEKPLDGRPVVCHASAWDFYNGIDFRVKQCTDITMDDLLTVHHEMGHIEYYLQYRTQPQVFRRGANPGFHEAVGDVMSLSVSTPKHLKEIGLLDTISNSSKADLNFLFKQALEKVSFLPFGYLVDQWRWRVFSGQTTSQQYNKHWWNLRCKYQGISPPVSRSESDFDPGAKYHVPANTPYIRDMLKLGSSVPWQQAMKKLTGSEKMDAQPLIEYFQPINEWLRSEQIRLKYRTVWTDACPSSASFLKNSYFVACIVILYNLPI